MIGFAIGTACLIGFIATALRGRGRRFGFAGGCHGGGEGYRSRRGGFGFRGRMMRGLFERLDTSPGQEKVIRSALDEVREAARKLRGEGKRSREEVGKAFRSPVFDEILFGEMFARHDASLEELRKETLGAAAKVHDALDERQRARLADMIESGPRAWAYEGCGVEA